MRRYIYTIAMLLIIPLTLFSQSNEWRRLIARPTYDIAVNPYNYNTVFAGGEGRIVYRSYDAGQTWDTIVIGYKSGATLFNNVYINPADTNVVLIGGLKFGDIRRSTDQGDTWEIVLQKDYPIATNGKAIVMQPDNPNIYYLGNYQNGAIFKSWDMGKTWDSISTVARVMTDSQATDFEHPLASDFAYIGSMGIRHDSVNIVLTNSTSGRIYMSHDSGYTWKYITTLTYPDTAQGDCEITRVVFTDRDPLTGYAVITYVISALNSNNGGLYKTTDGGYNWDLIAFKDTSMWAVATREYEGVDEIFMGGYTLSYWDPEPYKVPGVNLVYRSVDGGKSWHSYENKIDWVIDEPQYGPRGNVWSMRFFGPPGFEKLYMASEAGLFVLDQPGHIYQKGEIKVYQSNDNTITVQYIKKGMDTDIPIVCQLWDINGKLVTEQTIVTSSEGILADLYVENLAVGAYICRLYEGDISVVQKIMVNK